MSFHLSCENLHLECRDGRSYLKANAKRADGSDNHTEICLDSILGNNNGHFEWDGENFTGSAQNVSFSIEGGGAVPVLRAELRDADGNYHPRDVNLAERLDNNDGNLILV